MNRIARRPRARSPFLVAAVGLVLATPTTARARHVVFAETWENGTAAWRTQLANGVDCKSWPTCAFTATQMGGTFPAALQGNAIQVRNGDGAAGRDAKTCSGKYVNIPRAFAGFDAANLVVTGGVTHGGVPYANAQFPVALNDRLCIVAWIRAYDEGSSEAGPYIGINYAGAHGVVNAGTDQCTHFMIGPPPWAQGDPEIGCGRSGERPPYGNMTPIIPDGVWHRYKSSFRVNSGDVANWNLSSPGLPGGTTWNTADTAVYGQPRLLLFGKAPERVDAPAWAPPIQHDADFGDLYVFKADNGVEDPCPTDAELDKISWTSDHVVCAAGKACTTSVAALPAGDRTPAQPANAVNVCLGCTSSFGTAAAGPATCTATSPFCIGADALRGGTCTPCSGDAASSSEAATRCKADSPTCFTESDHLGSCGKCADDSSCAALAHAGPTCDVATGGCFACTGDWGTTTAKACPESAPRCEPGSGLCGKCLWNDECKGPHAGPLCHVPTGQCTTCASDFGAPAGPTTCPKEFPLCLTAPIGTEPVGVCGMCTSSANCINPEGKSTHAGAMCDGATGSCGKCDGDFGTSTTAFSCDATNPTCLETGNCVRCEGYLDCVNPPGVRLHSFSACNARSGACEGTPAEVPKCDGDLGMSTPKACRDRAAATCGGDGLCRKCGTDAACVNPPGTKLHARTVCDLATGACDQGPDAPVPPLPAGAGGDAGDDGGCSSAPAPSHGAAFGVLSIVGALLLGLRRKRRAR